MDGFKCKGTPPYPISCMILMCIFVCFQNYLRVTKPCTNHVANSKESLRLRRQFFCVTTDWVILDNLFTSGTIARNKNILDSVKWKFLSTEVSGLDTLFSSNHNIHKSSCGLCFWASDLFIDRFY